MTLRSVAVAATLILIWRPDALTGPGFQMSFAATTALVAVFGALSGARWRRIPRGARPIAAVVVSSAVAGGATAPVAAAHFNRFADYGLVANVLAVPVMGLLVIPGAVLAALLWPLGVSGVGFWVMGLGISWVLLVADWVANLPSAQTYVVAPDWRVLPLMAIGAVFALLWQGRLQVRALGIAPVVLGAGLWVSADRPSVLVADTGSLVGVLGPDGRALSKPRGDGFAAHSWLENDGDGSNQTEAFQRPGLAGEKGEWLFQENGWTLAHVTGRGAAERAEKWCDIAAIVVTSARMVEGEGPCKMLDGRTLSGLGAVGLSKVNGRWQMQTAREVTGVRLWTEGR